MMEESRVEETRIPNRPQTEMQSIEDFIKEHEALETMKASYPSSLNPADLSKSERKAWMQGEQERLASEKRLQRASRQAEQERTGLERKLKRTALEAEQKSLEEQESNLVGDIGSQNWVGTLLEYRNAHPKKTPGLTYTEELVPSIHPRFTCKVNIYESPHSFGGSFSFSNKKDAKKYASKKAVDWLVGNGFMPTDGSVKFPKPATPATPTVVVKSIGRGIPSPTASPKPAGGTTYAGQIPVLCHSLGLTAPAYKITKDLENAAFWSGYADFGGHPLIEGKVGEVRSVFGQKNAKELIATEVFSFLKDIERQRMGIEDDSDDRKRKSSAVAELEQSSGKAVKVAT